MVYVLSWFVVASLIALWSLAAWAMHAAAVWAVSNAGALTGAAAGTESLSLPAWMAPWLPPEIGAWVGQLMAGLGPFVDGVLQAVPALTGGLGVLTWVIWGLGTVLLVLVGAGLHLLIALWRRRGGGPGPQAGAAWAKG